MKIDNNTFSIPKRIEVATEHSLIESTPLTTLEIAWNKLSDHYTAKAEQECTQTMQDKQFYNYVLNGKVEIETALVNYDLIRQKVLSLRERGDSGDDNGAVINFKDYCVRECINTLKYQLETLRAAIEERRNEEKVLQLFTTFKIKIENHRILVKLTDKNVIDITNKLKNDGCDNFRFILRSLGISNKIVISCDYERMHFEMVHDLKDLSEIRKALEIADKNITAGKLSIVVESEEEHKKRLKSKKSSCGDNVKATHARIDENEALANEDGSKIGDESSIEKASESQLLGEPSKDEVADPQNNKTAKNTANNEKETRKESFGSSDINIPANSRISSNRFNHLICNFIYKALIHNTEPSYIVERVFILLSYYIAVNFYESNKFVRITHVSGNTQVMFFIRNKDKLRIEIKDQKEIKVFYNEGRVIMW
ncbi:hypothetical protein VCUG_02195 [Vavraia culicis subsp. floridensis]|uniref:Uncharacterized protein n=1 Tax=Vavraia culicis (isolate floridensis) TaxID=948595 RepID=L2GSG4_VAVCU|nr:uncharacterized protein VCUG_02195 [Vavraia culicis subsp. floridensis]ELA46307.1 hypothetical protein VCUG_02195 [Vavraia culicis subsp. floridensis]